MRFPYLQKNNQTRPLLEPVSPVKAKQSATRLSKIIAKLLLPTLNTLLKVRRKNQTTPLRSPSMVTNLTTQFTQSTTRPSQNTETMLTRNLTTQFTPSISTSQNMETMFTRNLTTQKATQITMITMEKTIATLSLTTEFSLSLMRRNKNLTKPFSLSMMRITNQITPVTIMNHLMNMPQKTTLTTIMF